MFRLLAIVFFMAVASPAEEALPELPRVYSNDATIGLILGHDLSEVGYVATHCEALDRYLKQILFMPALPPPKARIEILDSAAEPQVSIRKFGAEAFVQVQLGNQNDFSKVAAEAAVRTWLARAAITGGKPIDTAPQWLQLALIAETRVMLKPALLDLWYREGRQKAPDSLQNVLSGRATEGEAFLFWRVMRSELGSTAEQARVLIAVAQGADVMQSFPNNKMNEAGWQLARANLLFTRNPISLGMHESAEALDDISRFVYDVGEGDVILTGSEVVTYRDVAGIKMSMEARLATLRREILRQNPVYHNAWRSLGAWLENFPSASPEDLNKLWEEFTKERAASDALRREVESVMVKPPAQ